MRSRLWQMGIMRSVGLRRGQLLRLILAEAALLGIVGSLLGLLCGGLLSINAKRLLLVLTGFDPPFSIPWGIIWLGTGIWSWPCCFCDSMYRDGRDVWRR